MHCAKCFFYETSVGDDVCNRCGRAYLPEANVYLGLIILLTGSLAWALRHLLTGHIDPFVRPAIDLGAWGTWPVSMVERPAYGLVLGGWLGMLAATPLLTGLLYGKRGGWLLAMLVAVFGPSVWFAGAVAVGVWLAAGYTLRLRSKLASSLVGLAAPVAYLFVATVLTDFTKGESAAVAGQAAADGVAASVSAGRTLPPALRSLAYVLPVAAAVTAAVAAAVVVAVGKADRWHVRWPGSVLAVLTAGPMLALLALVGVDEVRYGMVLGPAPPVGPWADAAGSETDRLQEFLRRHPDSPRADQVRARLARRLARSPAAGEESRTRTAALGVWKQVLAHHPTSPYAADACLYLGDTAAQGGLFADAEMRWQQALERTRALEPPEEDPLADFNVVWDLFAVGNRLDAREQAERLADLRQVVLGRLAVLRENRPGSPANDRALALYYRAVALRGSNPYRQALVAAREAEPKGALADNVAVDLAMLVPEDVQRVKDLSAVATQWPDTDGAMLAHIRAAQTLVARAETDPGALRAARTHLLAAQSMLAARRRRSPDDPYVAAFGDRVDKELVYVQAQLRTPEADG